MVIPYWMTFDLLYSIMDDSKSVRQVLNALSIRVWNETDHEISVWREKLDPK